MNLIISGLSEQASNQYTAPFSEGCTINWQPASLFIADAENSREQTSKQWVWLYRAPWAWLADGHFSDSRSELKQWQTQQRAVLQLRRTLRQNLILVNIDRVQSQTLAKHFGFSYSGTQKSKDACYLAATLASLFETTAPECCTIYEALEEYSWRPNDASAKCSMSERPSYEGLIEILNLLKSPKSNSFISKSTPNDDQVEPDFGGKVPQTLKSSLKEENDFLLLQLHTLQEKLEQYHHSDTTEKKANDLLEQKLSETYALQQHLQHQLSNATTRIQSLSEDNDLLLSQLHTTQEELERYYFANREMIKEFHITEDTLHRARTLISRMSNNV